jgi:hypothetical protein
VNLKKAAKVPKGCTAIKDEEITVIAIIIIVGVSVRKTVSVII